MMKPFLRAPLFYVISWMMAFGFPLASFQESYGRNSTRFSPVMFRMTEAPVRPQGAQLDPYRALGLDGREAQASQAAIESAGSRRVLILEQARYRHTTDFMNRVSSAGSRAALLTELNEAAYLIEVTAAGQSVRLDLSREAAQSLERHMQQWRSTQPQLQGPELRQRATATALAEAIETHQDRFGKGALRQRARAVSMLSDAAKRYQYDFRHGIREGKPPKLPSRGTWAANRAGYARVVLPGTRGATVDIPLSQGLETPMSETIRGIRQGVGSYGIAAASFLLLSFTYTLTKMTTDYASNPLAVEELLDQYITPVYLLSFFTFGAAATTYQYAQRALVQRNIEALYDLARNKHLFANKPLERARVAKSAFAGLSFASLAFGFAASMGAFYLGEKALSCAALLNDGPMSRQERQEHEDMCDLSFVEFVENALPHIATFLPALWAAKWLMTLSGNAAQALRGAPGVYSTTKDAFAQKAARFNNRFNDPKFNTAARRSLTQGMKPGLPAGLAARAPGAVRFFRTAGAITLHMAGFVILIEVMSTGLRTGWESTSRGLQVGSHEGHLRMDFNRFVSDDLSLSSFCSTPLEGGWCAERESIFGRLDSYFAAMDELRLYHMRDMSLISDNWVRYFSKSLNMYLASSLFYKDVLDQITAQRRAHVARPFQYFVNDQGELSPRTYLAYTEHPLPLFRSSPLFGVRPEYVNASWFEGLTLKEAIEEDSRWDTGEVQDDLQFVRENLHEKMTLTQEVGQWLQEQASIRELPKFLQEHALKVSQHLSSPLLHEQMAGIELIHESSKLFPWRGDQCRRNERTSAQPECLFYFAQERLTDVLLSAASILEENMALMDDENQKSAEQIIGLLRSAMAEDRQSGLELLKDNVEKIRDTKALACETVTTGLCAFREAQRVSSRGPFHHRNRPDYGGYLREATATPGGPNPLAPGHKYLMDFYTSLDQFGIDYDWYPKRKAGDTMGSMSHYLATSMLCGPSTFSESSNIITRRLGGLIPAMPDFHPPKLPTVSGQDYCQGLKDETSIYHSIAQAEGEPWRGIVDLLYHDAAQNVTGGEFRDWWSTHATRPMENLILEKEVKYAQDLRDKYKNFLIGREGFWGNLRNNLTSLVSTGQPVTYLDSLNSELDLFFWGLFYPIYNDPDTLWYEPNLPMGDEEEIATFKTEYLSFLEVQLRDGLESGIRTALSDPGKIEEAFEPAELALEKLKQLFQGWDDLYFSQMIWGEVPEYPQLSYRNRPEREGIGYDANWLMRDAVFPRLESLITNLKFDLIAKANFFEEMRDQLP